MSIEYQGVSWLLLSNFVSRPICRCMLKDGLLIGVWFYSGYVQGGSDGMPILGDFAIKYGSRGGDLGVPTDDLYQALVDTAENTVSGFYLVACLSFNIRKIDAPSLPLSHRIGIRVRIDLLCSRSRMLIGGFG